MGNTALYRFTTVVVHFEEGYRQTEQFDREGFLRILNGKDGHISLEFLDGNCVVYPSKKIRHLELINSQFMA